MTITDIRSARPRVTDRRATSNADFQTLQRIVELHGFPAVLAELVTLTSMEANKADALGRRSRNADRRANFDLRAEFLFSSATTLARAANETECAGAVDVRAIVG